MATVIPAIRGEMGSTTYWLGTINARELAATARPASERDNWANLSIEERMQRELNMARVRNEIVPYLANSDDRFFGAFVILVYKADLSFEGLKDLGGKVPAAYKSVAEKIGFLTIEGGELIVLDGQHRLAALREVTQSGKVAGPYVGDVPNDDLEVVFINFDNEDEERSNQKIRRLFNKLNRYAKSTGRGDNIITSEDDGYAILTRRLLRAGEPLGLTVVDRNNERDLIVNWRSNTISQRSVRFTTVSAVYETVQTILQHNKFPNLDEKSTKSRPSDEQLDAAYEFVHEWWDTVVHRIKPFAEAFEDYQKIPDMREPGQPYSLLFKPAAHIILFRALSRALRCGATLEAAVDRVNEVEWDIEHPQWKGILIQPNGRISARKEHYDVTAKYVAYLIGGEHMSEEENEETRALVASFKFDKSADQSAYVLP